MSNNYQLINLDGTSPFNNRPGTHFRQATYGVLRSPHCELDYSGVRKPQQINKPQKQGESIKPVIQCPTEQADMLTVLVGEVFEPKGTELNGFRSKLTIEFDDTMLELVAATKLKALTYGLHTIKLNYAYPFDTTCSQLIGVLAIDAEQNQCRFEIPTIVMRVGELLQYEDFISNEDVSWNISEAIIKLDVEHVVKRYGHLSMQATNPGEVNVTVIFKNGMEKIKYNEDGSFEVTNFSEISYCIKQHKIQVVTEEEYAQLQAGQSNTEGDV